MVEFPTADQAAFPTLAQQSDADVFEKCPKCDRSLGPPLQSSGRQVCSRCGWTNKPRTVVEQDNLELDLGDPSQDLKKLLEQAATEALENMQPKRNPEQNPSGIRKFFPFKK